MNGYSNTRQLFDKAVARLAGSTGIFDPAQKSGDPEASVIVYNGLSWPRGGPVEVSRLPAALREESLEVVDRVTGEVLPCEDVPQTHRIIMFFSPPVPAFGYRVFSVRKSAAQRPPAGSFPIAIKWNQEGWIRSIRDEASGTEMVDAKSPHPFGSVFTTGNRDDYLLKGGTAAAPVVVEGPVARSIEIARQNSPLRRTAITVYSGASYADIAFDVDFQQMAGDSARYAIALPVAGLEQSWIDGAGLVYRTPQDVLPGGGAAQYTPLHFAHFSLNATNGITIANRDAFVLRPDRLFLVASQGLLTKTRDEGTQRLFRTEPRGSRLQTFRFRLAAQMHKPAEWKKFGRELNLPLQAAVIPKTQLTPERGFFSVSHPAVEITAIKPAEYQAGWYMLRLQEMGGEVARNVSITTPFRVLEAVIANTVETPSSARADLSRMTLHPWETVTIVLRLDANSNR